MALRKARDRKTPVDVVCGPAKVGDPAVTELDEVLDSHRDPGGVVRGDGGDLDIVGPAVDHDHSHSLALQLLQQRMLEAGGGDDQALDLA